MQRISHLSYYTTPAVGKSRTAATGRSGWAEAADRFARAALCLRLLYHKTLSTGTKTRGKSGSCLKNIRNSERGSARFSGNPCSRNRPSSGESSRSGKTLWFRAGSWKAPEKSSGFGKNSCSGKTFQNREDPAVLFCPQTPLGKEALFRENTGASEEFRGKAGLKVSKYYEK